MKPEEWLACTETATMLDFLCGAENSGRPAWLIRNPRRRTTDRKLRLFSVACCRLSYHVLTDGRSRQAIEVAERFADGGASKTELAKAWEEAGDVTPTGLGDGAWQNAHRCAWHVATALAAEAAIMTARKFVVVPSNTMDWYESLRAVQAQHIELLCCIFGNPFRPLNLPPSLLTDSVLAIARGIYEERAWDRLPVLADALEENGFADQATLAHCRVDTLHARGCHVVDLILAKK
jgi:hypothetical protein